MSSEHLVQDPEKGLPTGKEAQDRPLSPPKSQGGPWKCLSITAFLLLAAATGLFAFLQYGTLFGQKDSQGNGKSFADDILPETMKLQALVSGKPAAHAIASLNHPNQLIWTTDVAPSVLENGMKLDKAENALVVPSTGLYFVYSQLLFHKGSCTDPVLLSQRITWRSAQFNSEVELLKSLKTACEHGRDPPNQGKFWFESIYQGAVFKLHKGDRLWSKTDSLQYLDLSQQGQIYFGVIAM
ncbi:tumor necrosis factor [Anolis carolinensis]|uniref:tumor necrosis factor n=1 Tax=Anolis carolinensis TaxID=28377 RepID=UPI002F2B2537